MIGRRRRKRKSERERRRRRNYRPSLGNRLADQIPGDEITPEPMVAEAASGKTSTWLSTVLTALALVITALVVSGSAQF